jgi:hypothetical protein
MPGVGGGTIDEQRAIGMYRSGMSLSQIAAEIGATRQGVHVALRRCGVQLRSRGNSGGQQPLAWITAELNRQKRRIDLLEREICALRKANQ